MANPEHVAKLKEGADAWNAWRETTGERPDLSGMMLVDYSLDEYNLQFADFSGTFLADITFQSSRCDDCSFERADLSVVIFTDTNLNRANFKSSLVRLTVFNWCDLDESDFTSASLTDDTFAGGALQGVRGLGALGESRRNSIGIDTFFKSGGLPEFSSATPASPRSSSNTPHHWLARRSSTTPASSATPPKTTNSRAGSTTTCRGRTSARGLHPRT